MEKKPYLNTRKHYESKKRMGITKMWKMKCLNILFQPGQNLLIPLEKSQTKKHNFVLKGGFESAVFSSRLEFLSLTKIYFSPEIAISKYK